MQAPVSERECRGTDVGTGGMQAGTGVGPVLHRRRMRMRAPVSPVYACVLRRSLLTDWPGRLSSATVWGGAIDGLAAGHSAAFAAIEK